MSSKLTTSLLVDHPTLLTEHPTILSNSELTSRASSPLDLSLIRNIQIAAGFDHIYAFDPLGVPTADNGLAAPAPITVVNGPPPPADQWSNNAPTVPGTLGSYSQTVQFFAGNRLETAPAAVNMARTGDVWWEGIFEFAGALPAFGGGSLARAGTGVAGLSTVQYIAGTGMMELLAPNLVLQSFLPGFNGPYILNAPTYFACAWNHAASLYDCYFRKIGQPEVHDVSIAVIGAGAPGLEQLFVSGDGVSTSTVPMVVHMFGVNRGTITQAHRDLIYSAMGI